MPEFKNTQDMMDSTYLNSKGKLKHHTFVGGGFAALGNPSSFHNKFVRRIRLMAHQTVLENVFNPILKADEKLKFEQIVDRMMFRRPSQTPGREAWHRDVCLNAKEGDTVYGGWVNLDSNSQFFSGCPGTHKDVNKNKGFVRIDKSEHSKYKEISKKIEIPPGHIFIFYERMVHEVLSNSKPTDQHRLFLGWRTTVHDTPLIPDLMTRLQKRDIMPIKSGQIPMMYPVMYWINHKHLAGQLSKNVVAECMVDRLSKKEGKMYKLVGQRLKSLEEYNLITDLCPDYTQTEIDILTPRRTWTFQKRKRSD
tara:strand:+ start:489 stop:1412 length:924 start_codon:yes stop_codon:yes gene_type:complete